MAFRMVSRVGPTDDFVVRNLVEALELFMASCYRRGQLDRVLKGLPVRALHPESLAARRQG